jgi:hypothetical protein
MEVKKLNNYIMRVLSIKELGGLGDSRYTFQVENDLKLIIRNGAVIFQQI